MVAVGSYFNYFQTGEPSAAENFNTAQNVKSATLINSCMIENHAANFCNPEMDSNSKLLLPENICTSSLQKLAEITSRSSMRKKHGGSPRYAHALVEVALSPQISRGYAEGLLDKAQEELVNVNEGGTIPEKLKIEADTLDAYMPAYYERILQRTPSTKTIIKTYQNLTAILRDYAKTYTTYEAVSRTVGVCVQVELGALLMRTLDPAYFVWPASFREEDGQPSTLNHDIYNIRNRQKVPVQIKLNAGFPRVYDSRVTVITYDALGFGDSMTLIADKGEAAIDHTIEKWEEHETDTIPHVSFHGTENAFRDTQQPDDFTPFVPHTMTHELTSALVSEAHHMYMPDQAFKRVEAMTHYLKDCIDLSYAGPSPKHIA